MRRGTVVESRFSAAPAHTQKSLRKYCPVPMDTVCPCRMLDERGEKPVLRTVLLIILILILLGSLPLWPYSSGWGYYPSGGLGLVLIIIIIFILLDRRRVV